MTTDQKAAKPAPTETDLVLRGIRRNKIGLLLVAVILAAILGVVWYLQREHDRGHAHAKVLQGQVATLQAQQAQGQNVAMQVSKACKSNDKVVLQTLGIPCAQASVVAAQPTVTAGAPGTNGVNGVNGTNGSAGTNGVNGTNGAVGPEGPQGNPGPTGAAGPSGASGTSGTSGADGQDGAAGANGAVGAPGPAGANGVNGEDGATGPTGPAGPTGATGNGIQSVSCTGTDLLPGDTFTFTYTDGTTQTVQCTDATTSPSPTPTPAETGSP